MYIGQEPKYVKMIVYEWTERSQNLLKEILIKTKQRIYQTACKIRAFVHVVENYSNVSSLKRANLLRKARLFFLPILL